LKIINFYWDKYGWNVNVENKELYIYNYFNDYYYFAFIQKNGKNDGEELIYKENIYNGDFNKDLLFL